MKRIPIVLSVLIAIVVLFGSTEVKAIVVNPCNQISGPIITQVAPEKYKWTYQFPGPISNTQLYILAPVCTRATMYTVDNGGSVLPPGTGDSTTGFGVGDTSNVVILLKFSSPNSFYFYTDKLVPTRSTSMQIKFSRTSYYICPNIQGPACPGIPQSLTPLNTTECKTLGGLYVLVTRDPATGCATDVQQCNNADCTDCGEILPSSPPPVVNGEPLIGCTTPDGNQMCQECIIYSESSPGCYTYSSGGRTYKICK